jgi:hypothetical protein
VCTELGVAGVYSVVSFSTVSVVSCCEMSRPLVLHWMCSYQSVSLALKSPSSIMFGICNSNTL